VVALREGTSEINNNNLNSIEVKFQGQVKVQGHKRKIVAKLFSAISRRSSLT